MKKIVIERVEDCPLVMEKNYQCGHDCWGNTEWRTEYYVYIKDKYERVFPNSGFVIIHDGKNVLRVELLSLLPYQNLGKEIVELLENKEEKRDRIIDDITQSQ